MIYNNRISLERFQENMISPEYVSWLNDKELLKYSEQRHNQHDFRSCLGYVKSFQGSLNYLWAIKVNQGTTHVGNINAYVDKNNGIADVGILIGNKEESGKGLGFEAWFMVMYFLFNKNGIRKITAGTMAANQAMKKLATKAQMNIEGVRPKHFLVDGEPVDLIYFGIFREHFEKQLLINPIFKDLGSNTKIKFEEQEV